ncbi:hypothetical protein SUDANB23_06724 (plasmid) [Streptomyces sp. enrichment culture]
MEHLRIGGEDAWDKFLIKQAVGTPPQRRGGPVKAVHRDDGLRSTPATAGRTAELRTSTGPSTEHPRIGGEDSMASHVPSGTIGTPPRRWGGRHSKGPRVWCTRCPCARPEHPRIGEEDNFRASSTGESCGTPSRRRGGRQAERIAAELVRSTPASAGGRCAADGGPPRRNTPASAGRTCHFQSARPGAPEHPHVGREDLPTRRCSPTIGPWSARSRGARKHGQVGSGQVLMGLAAVEGGFMWMRGQG